VCSRFRGPLDDHVVCVQAHGVQRG
jgi:hypothetical protein